MTSPRPDAGQQSVWPRARRESRFVSMTMCSHGSSAKYTRLAAVATRRSSTQPFASMPIAAKSHSKQRYGECCERNFAARANWSGSTIAGGRARAALVVRGSDLTVLGRRSMVWFIHRPVMDGQMSSSIQIEIHMPDDLDRFRLPEGVQQRLQALLDKQDQGQPLTDSEQREAEGLVNLADLLSLLRLRTERLSI